MNIKIINKQRQILTLGCKRHIHPDVVFSEEIKKKAKLNKSKK